MLFGAKSKTKVRCFEMHYNEGYLVDIMELYPHGTNSTFFTNCCQYAITDGELCCPGCGRKVVGAEAETDHERRIVRWKNATRFWKRGGVAK
jgi:hypothetical protein